MPRTLIQVEPNQRPRRPSLTGKKNLKPMSRPLVLGKTLQVPAFFEKSCASCYMTIFTNGRPARFTGKIFKRPLWRPVVEWERCKRSKPQNEPETTDFLGFLEKQNTRKTLDRTNRACRALTAPRLTGLAISVSKVLKALFKSNKIQNGRKLAKSG